MRQNYLFVVRILSTDENDVNPLIFLPVGFFRRLSYNINAYPLLTYS